MIIDFRAHALRLEPRLEASTTGAEIIIFPGVRASARATQQSRAAKTRRAKPRPTSNRRTERAPFAICRLPEPLCRAGGLRA